MKSAEKAKIGKSICLKPFGKERSYDEKFI